MEIEITCPVCGAIHYATVVASEFDLWQSGELIQNAMPHADATTREQLVSGLCPMCQDEIFG